MIGDIGRMRQILTNLIGNAVKFTEAGHVLVDVSDDPSPSKTGRAPELSRSRTRASAYPPTSWRTIFEKFSQVDGSSTRRHEGTGLGLAIASPPGRA